MLNQTPPPPLPMSSSSTSPLLRSDNIVYHFEFSCLMESRQVNIVFHFDLTIIKWAFIIIIRIRPSRVPCFLTSHSVFYWNVWNVKKYGANAGLVLQHKKFIVCYKIFILYNIYSILLLIHLLIWEKLLQQQQHLFNNSVRYWCSSIIYSLRPVCFCVSCCGRKCLHLKNFSQEYLY